jgi:hypothetical protein
MKYIKSYYSIINENKNSDINVNDYAYHVTNTEHFDGSLSPIWDSQIIEHFYGDDLRSCDIDLEDYGVYDYIFFAKYPMLHFVKVEAGNTVEIDKLVVCGYDKHNLEHREEDDEDLGGVPLFIEPGDYYIRRSYLIPDFYYIGKDAYDFVAKNWPDELKKYQFI